MSSTAARPWTAEWLRGKTLADLQAIEHGGRLLFPDVLRRARADGKWEEVPVMLRVPRPQERAAARVEAVELFRTRKLDRQADADLFDEFERMALLARCILERTPPHEQHALTDWLLGSGGEGKGYDQGTLWDAWQKIQAYQSMTSPQAEDMGVEDIVAAARGVARVGNLTPFAAIAGPAQDACVIGMARLLDAYLTDRSSGPSPETSTAAS